MGKPISAKGHMDSNLDKIVRGLKTTILPLGKAAFRNAAVISMRQWHDQAKRHPMKAKN